MKVTRREFLRLLGNAGVAMPALLGPSACTLPVVDTPDPGTGLSLGYTAGDVTANGAVIWLRAAPDSAVSIQYGKDEALQQFAETKSFKVRDDADSTALISLDGLEPKSTYYYRAVVEGRRAGPIARFVTAPRSDDPAKVSFCFSGDSRESYKPFTIMDAVRAQRPDFFLHLGDTIYADRGGSARRLDEFWAKYRANRDDAATQRCFLETSWYVVWDDHEVEDNFAPDHPLAPIGRRAFLDYWPVRHNPREPERIYRAFHWGQTCELFLLDARQYRDRERGTMLGAAQKRWLFDGLLSSSALFKFVATSVAMYGGGSDRWDGYPKERAELLRFIAANNIRGVVFLSADLHYAAVIKIPGKNGLKEIAAGPLAAAMNVITNSAASRFEFFSNKTFNFAKITVDPKVDPTHASVEFIDEENQLFHSTKIRAV
jgi:alkaline phosphatase D